jgi:predicted Zn-dependent protease
MRAIPAFAVVFGLLVATSSTSAWPNFDDLKKTVEDVIEKKEEIEDNKAFKLVVQTAKGFQDITEEQEYYIGRAVTANILSTYPLVEDSVLTAYVNRVGAVIVAHCDRPEIYAGYHFGVFESEAPNAVSAPGGYVLLSRGLLEELDSEDQLAAVLAHEVAHISLKHGLQAIKKSRLTTAFSELGKEVASGVGGRDMKKLVSAYEGSVEDVFKTLLDRGYSRDQEFEADRLGIEVLSRTRYDPRAMLQMLQNLESAQTRGLMGGWMKTHPEPKEREEKAEPHGANLPSPPEENVEVRTQRFVEHVPEGEN